MAGPGQQTFSNVQALPPPAQTFSNVTLIDQPAPGMPLAPDAWGRLKQAYEGTLPILDYDMATLAGVGSIARDTVGAVKGGWNLLKTAGRAWDDPKADVGDVVLPDPHVEQVRGAVRDINASPDPTGTYLKVAGDTASQGAGAAITALATEGAARGVPAVKAAAADVADTPIAQAIKAGTEAALKELPKAAIKRVPYAGNVGADVVKAARDAYTEARNPNPGAPLPATPAPELLEANRKLADLMQPNVNAGAPLPATPPAQVLQAASLLRGPKPLVDPAAGLGQIPIRKLMETPTPAALDKAVIDSVTAPVKRTPIPMKKIGAAVDDALGVAQPAAPKFAPRTSLKNQIAAQQLPEGFTATPKSSHVRGYQYNPETETIDAVTDTGRYRHAGVTQDLFDKFKATAEDSPGTAWKQLRDGPGVTPLGKVNAAGEVGSPRIKPHSQTFGPETDLAQQIKDSSPPAKETDFKPVTDLAKSIKKSAAAPKKAATPAAASPDEDLSSSWAQNAELLASSKGSTKLSTTADPVELSKRWGVDEASLQEGREQTRGMTPKQTESYMQKLTDRYKGGEQPDPVIEYRDADNNLISVDGRARVLAAQRAGIKRIPVIVRRLKTTVPTQ